MDTGSYAQGGALHVYSVLTLRGAVESAWSNVVEIRVEAPAAEEEPAPLLRPAGRLWSANLTVGDIGYSLLGYYDGDAAVGALAPVQFQWGDDVFTVTALGYKTTTSGLTLQMSTGDWQRDQALSQVNHGDLDHVHVLRVGDAVMDFADASVRQRVIVGPNTTYIGYLTYSWSGVSLDWTEADTVGQTVTVQLDRMREINPADQAPTNLTAEAVTGGVSLSWDTPAEDAGLVTGYRIQRASRYVGFSILVGDTTYTDATATEPGEFYHYRVLAIRGAERSAPSSAAGILMPSADDVQHQMGTQDSMGRPILWEATLTVDATGQLSDAHAAAL